MKHYWRGVKNRLQHWKRRLHSSCLALIAPERMRLNRYCENPPAPEEMIRLFEGEWLSALPPPYSAIQAGIYPLFNDPRMKWAFQALGGIKGKKILELGPLEGAHSYMIEKEHPSSLLAIEANPKAFLKCLVIKELLQLKQTRFLLGDFNGYLRSTSETFDCCIASGVLYHMKNPIELLGLIAKSSASLFLWTHYFDAELCAKPQLKEKFHPPYRAEAFGFSHTLHPFSYGSSRKFTSFIGGPAASSCWVSRQEILDALLFFGFREIMIQGDIQDEAKGPSFSLIAKKN